MGGKAAFKAMTRHVVKPNPADELEYKDKKQVELDVSRVSLSKAAAAKLERRVALVLSANQGLNYYQGFHDIAMHTHSTKQLENLALQQLRDFMTSNLIPTMQILHLIPELIAVCDPHNVGRYFQLPKNTSPDGVESRKLLGYFALAPIVTLFSHDCQDSQVIIPIIRNVMKEGLAYVLYLYVALAIENGGQLLEKVTPDSDDDEIDMALQGLPSTISADNFPALDRKARRLRSHHPLRSLLAYKSISRFSVLRTGKITKRSTALYTLGQLEKASIVKSQSLTALALPRTMVAMAMGAIAVGLLWTRLRK